MKSVRWEKMSMSWVREPLSSHSAADPEAADPLPVLALASLHSCASPLSMLILRCTRAEQPPIAGFLGWMAVGMVMHPPSRHQAQDEGLEGGSCRRLRFSREHVRG